jgi:hypothetical protein
MAWLHVLRGPNSGTRVALEREHTAIGRSPECDLVVPITAIGRQHDRLSRVGDQFVVEDLNSRGGTWVNRRQIRGPTPVRHGDHLQICDFVAVFETERPPAEGQVGQGQGLIPGHHRLPSRLLPSAPCADRLLPAFSWGMPISPSLAPGRPPVPGPPVWSVPWARRRSPDSSTTA